MVRTLRNIIWNKDKSNVFLLIKCLPLEILFGIKTNLTRFLLIKCLQMVSMKWDINYGHMVMLLVKLELLHIFMTLKWDLDLGFCYFIAANSHSNFENRLEMLFIIQRAMKI